MEIENFLTKTSLHTHFTIQHFWAHLEAKLIDQSRGRRNFGARATQFRLDIEFFDTGPTYTHLLVPARPLVVPRSSRRWIPLTRRDRAITGHRQSR